jgi:hypothetical protein
MALPRKPRGAADLPREGQPLTIRVRSGCRRHPMKHLARGSIAATTLPRGAEAARAAPDHSGLEHRPVLPCWPRLSSATESPVLAERSGGREVRGEPSNSSGIAGRQSPRGPYYARVRQAVGRPNRRPARRSRASGRPRRTGATRAGGSCRLRAGSWPGSRPRQRGRRRRRRTLRRPRSARRWIGGDVSGLERPREDRSGGGHCPLGRWRKPVLPCRDDEVVAGQAHGFQLGERDLSTEGLVHVSAPISRSRHRVDQIRTTPSPGFTLTTTSSMRPSR